LLASADGTRRRVVVGDSRRHSIRPVQFAPLSWSPHGGSLAITANTARHPGSESDPGDRFDVVIVRADGSRVRRLTHDRRSGYPLWSPRGARIVYTHFARSFGSASLWSMRPDGTHKRRLLRPSPGTIDVATSFSPHGARLLFARAPLITPNRAVDEDHVDLYRYSLRDGSVRL